MQPGAISPVPVSFVSVNSFAALQEVVLPGTGFVFSSPSHKSHQRLARHRRLSSALRISHISLSSDLGSEDPITLSCHVNQSLPATLMLDSGPSSQFIDHDYVKTMNLPMTLKPKPEDLALTDGSQSIIGQITHTCTLTPTIDQHMEEVIFQVTKIAG